MSIGAKRPSSEIDVNALSLLTKKHNPSHFSPLKGFTFIEILLVVVLLGVLVTVSIPSFHASFQTLLLKDSTQDMVALMRYAQSRAVVKNETIEFIYDGANRGYALYEFDADQQAADDQRGLKRISGPRGRVYKIPSELEYEATQDKVVFTPDGKISPARFYLCLKDRCLTVSTQDQAGRVLLLQGSMK